MCTPYRHFYVHSNSFPRALKYLRKILNNLKGRMLKLTMLRLNILFIPKRNLLFNFIRFINFLKLCYVTCHTVHL